MKTIQRWESSDIDFKDPVHGFLGTAILIALISFNDSKDNDLPNEKLQRVVAAFLNTATDCKITIAESIPEVFIKD